MRMKKLFALTLSLICSAQLWAKDYQVADFGVMADGTTLNTRAIQRAIYCGKPGYYAYTR